MITKLSRIDSSSSSLKYSTRTCVNLCKNMMISAALEFRFDSARTYDRINTGASVKCRNTLNKDEITAHDIGSNVECACS